MALGGGDLEALIALGLVPAAPVLVQPSEVNFEQIADLAPDLVLYVNTSNDQAVYSKLAAIADTVAGPASVKNAYGVPRQEQLRIIATAVGRQAAVPPMQLLASLGFKIAQVFQNLASGKAGHVAYFPGPASIMDRQRPPATSPARSRSAAPSASPPASTSSPTC